MKPPLRPRSAPARFAAAPAAAVPAHRATWTGREKRALLRALREQAAMGLMEPEPGRMREWLPRRSESEIQLELTRLRGRAAREAVGAQHRVGLKDQQQHREQRPAPIQVWLQLAQTLCAPLEEVETAAFSQALTVAGTEPLNVKGGALGVDYGRLYGFLARGARGGDGPELQPAEAAVLLSLLLSLPPHVGSLPHVPALRRHFRGSFVSLIAPRSPPRPHSPAPPASPWKPPGPCPLNPFMVPLRLLKAAPPPAPQ